MSTDSSVLSLLGVVSILIGLACIVAGAVGGDLNIITRPVRIEVPLVSSALRQWFLVMIGIVFIAVGAATLAFSLREPRKSPEADNAVTSTSQPPPSPLASASVGYQSDRDYRDPSWHCTEPIASTPSAPYSLFFCTVVNLEHGEYYQPAFIVETKDVSPTLDIIVKRVVNGIDSDAGHCSGPVQARTLTFCFGGTKEASSGQSVQGRFIVRDQAGPPKEYFSPARKIV